MRNIETSMLYYLVVATHPISNATSNTAECKTPGVVFAGIDAVVSSMAGVVRNHGPAGIRPGGQCSDRDRIWVEPHCCHSQCAGNVAPVEDLFYIENRKCAQNMQCW